MHKGVSKMCPRSKEASALQLLLARPGTIQRTNSISLLWTIGGGAAGGRGEGGGGEGGVKLIPTLQCGVSRTTRRRDIIGAATSTSAA